MLQLRMKNADFSGATLSHYRPPVDDARVAAFAGDENSFDQNFGSASLNLKGDTPEQDSAGFRLYPKQNNPTPFFETDVAQATEMTFIVLMKRPQGDEAYSVGFSNEFVLPVADDHMGRAIGFKNDQLFYQHWAPRNDRVSYVLVDYSYEKGETAFICVTFADTTDGSNGGWYRIHDFQNKFPDVANSGLADPDPAELDQMRDFGIGFTPYRDGFRHGQNALPIGFVGIWSRILSDAEQDTMYRSIKARFDARGISL